MELTAEVLVLNRITGSCQVRLTCHKQGTVVQKLVNAFPGLKVKAGIYVKALVWLLGTMFLVQIPVSCSHFKQSKSLCLSHISTFQVVL